MVLSAILLLMLLTATATEAHNCNFNLDCGNLTNSLYNVCSHIRGHPSRSPRDTLSVGTDWNTSSNPATDALHLTTDPEIMDEDPMLSPVDAFMVFKIHQIGGRFRRSTRAVNPRDECCGHKQCTLHEIAGYCQTFQSNYSFLSSGNHCA